MINSHIKRILSIMMLAAFIAPSGFATPAYDASGYISGASSILSLSSASKLTDKNSNITLSLRDSDVKQVLRMFADKAGLNVVFHSSVDGKVTLDLVNMPINDAFNLVVKVAGLNYYKQNNTLIVLSKNAPENATYSKQEMMIFPIKYVAASKIADFLNKNVFGMKMAGLSSVDAATVNSATNELVIFGMPSDAAIVEKVISQFDKEPITKTFTVNHTTPAEMADMVCNLLLPSRGVSSSGGSSGGSEGFMPPTPGVGTGGAAGIMTGGAASASGSSNGIVLGEGVVACTVTQSASSGSAFNVQGLAVSYYPQRGTITVVGGSEAQLLMIEKFIKNNDIKQPQAYIEMSIIELNEDGQKDFANTWQIESRAWNATFNGSSTTVGRVAVPSPGTREYLHLQRASDDGTSLEDLYLPREQWYKGGTFISWTMNYVIKNGKGRVLANPKLIVTNGQESTIDLTQDYVEKVTSEFLSSASNGTSTVGLVQRTYTIGEDLGIKITLTPFISPDGYVTMDIKPEYTTIASNVTSPGATSESDIVATLLSRRNLDLKSLRIKDGETLIIGGLIQESETKTNSKIPVLGDLPVIGSLFRSSQNRKTKTETIIMISPKIIVDGDDTVADNL